jgi:hypothetical protein
MSVLMNTSTRIIFQSVGWVFNPPHCHGGSKPTLRFEPTP